MTSRDFCFWLQGFFEIADKSDTAGAKDLSREQLKLIRDHLGLVFAHEIDPTFGDKKKQDILNAIHNAKPPLGDGLIMRC